jgi:hypothetical protein
MGSKFLENSSMQTDDFFRARIDAMSNLSDPLTVLR